MAAIFINHLNCGLFCFWSIFAIICCVHCWNNYCIMKLFVCCYSSNSIFYGCLIHSYLKYPVLFLFQVQLCCLKWCWVLFWKLQKFYVPKWIFDTCCHYHNFMVALHLFKSSTIWSYEWISNIIVFFTELLWSCSLYIIYCIWSWAL